MSGSTMPVYERYIKSVYLCTPLPRELLNMLKETIIQNATARWRGAEVCRRFPAINLLIVNFVTFQSNCASC